MNLRQLMEYSAGIIMVRDIAKTIYFSQSPQETFTLIENLARAFEFHQEESMVRKYP